MGIETYNGVVHGARIGPRDGTRGELMDSLVPMVAQRMARAEQAFVAGRAMRKA